MAKPRVRFGEVTFSPNTQRYAVRIPHDTYFGGLTRGRERARAEFGVEIRWSFDIVRDVKDEARKRVCADYTTSVAIEGKNDGVVALGLGGGEVGQPPEQFAGWFEKARGAGLHSVPHAGETAGPASVWGALRALSAERIGHSERAIEDAALVAHLPEHPVPLKLCPTSNVRVGGYANYAEHPLPRLHAPGVPVTINSDNPPLSNTTLNEEVKLLADPFNF